jgi:hypothetical protein
VAYVNHHQSVLQLVHLFPIVLPLDGMHEWKEVGEITQPNAFQKHHEAWHVQQASESAIQLAYT